MRNSAFYSLVVLVGLCTAAQTALAAGNAYNFPGSLKQSVNIRVVESRPKEETVFDDKFPTGFAYSTFGAEAQLQAFALEIGAHLVEGRAVPGYNNLNMKDVTEGPGLLFTFVVTHWYSKFPLSAFANRSAVVLIEGEFATALTVSQGGNVIYTKEYSTIGNKMIGAMDRSRRQTLQQFVDGYLDAKGNQVLSLMLGEVITDLEGQWSMLMEKEPVTPTSDGVAQTHQP